MGNLGCGEEKEMKVMIAIGNRSVGGAQRVAMHLCKWINNKSGSSAVIVSLKSTVGKTYNMTEQKCVDLQNSHTIKQLVKTIKEIKPDVVISLGVPMVVYTVPACKLADVKHVISERNDPAHFAGKNIIKKLSRLLLKLGDGFVFQTNDASDFYGMKKESIVIPNPLADESAFPSESKEGSRKKTIVTAGRLVDQKNHTLLINAFADVVEKHPEYKLIIWGEGPDREKLESHVAAHGMEGKVILPGATDQLLREINDAGMFVLSSDFEGMPNALMEAMALGLPCISTDCPCGGPKDLIDSGRNGLLVPVNDKDAMAAAILNYIENPAFADKCGNCAIEIRETHKLENICQRWYDFLSKVCGVK